MANIDKVIETFMNGEYFLIFLVLMVIILVVLILALVKSREDYKELLENKTVEVNPNLIDELKDNDPIDDLESLRATNKEDIIDEDKPLIKQIDVPKVKKYDDIIDEYESSEEENAVISASELEKRTKERLDALGTTDNQVAIQKYEEDQEKKAIISYEQLLKNASNITLSYVEEDNKDKSAPKINKIEIEQKEVTGVENYIDEEEFLKILKEFRTSL